MPWWVAPLSEDPPDLSIFDKDWADRPASECPLLPDGTRAGPYWDSIDPRLKGVRKYDERLWFAAGAFALEVCSCVCVCFCLSVCLSVCVCVCLCLCL